MSKQRALLFIIDPAAPSDEAASYLLDALSSQCDVLAVIGKTPRKTARNAAGAKVGPTVDLECEAPGLIEAVARFRRDAAPESYASYDELVVASSSLLGPLSDITDVFAQLDSLEAPVRTLVRAGAELDIDLPMDWLSIDISLLSEGRLWEPVADEESSDQLRIFLRRALACGLTYAWAYPHTDKDVLLRSDRAGLPLLPWALFTADPLLLERWATSAAKDYQGVVRSGYPGQVFWSHLLHAAAPQTWYTNLALLDIVPARACGQGAVRPSSSRTAAIVHIYYTDMVDELLRYAGNLPDPVSLIVTTDTDSKKAAIEAMLGRQDRFTDWEVRVVQTNRGRDISAFLLDCADILRDPRFDVIVKLHSKKSVQDPHSVSDSFRAHLLENLLHSPDHAAAIVTMFEDDPQLGMVFPPIVHMGLPTMGNGWTLNREPARRVADRLGVTIPFDASTPLSPYGSMFIARREALLPLLDANFSADEFPDGAEYRDGSLAHVVERLYSYVAYSQGFYSRCVQTPELAALSAVTLEYKLDAVSSFIHPHAIEQVKILSSPGQLERNSRMNRAIHTLDARVPIVGKIARRAKRAALSARSRIGSRRSTL